MNIEQFREMTRNAHGMKVLRAQELFRWPVCIDADAFLSHRIQTVSSFDNRGNVVVDGQTLIHIGAAEVEGLESWFEYLPDDRQQKTFVYGNNPQALKHMASLGAPNAIALVEIAIDQTYIEAVFICNYNPDGTVHIVRPALDEHYDELITDMKNLRTRFETVQHSNSY